MSQSHGLGSVLLVSICIGTVPVIYSGSKKFLLHTHRTAFAVGSMLASILGLLLFFVEPTRAAAALLAPTPQFFSLLALEELFRAMTGRYAEDGTHYSALPDTKLIPDVALSTVGFLVSIELAVLVMRAAPP